ncbi:sulfatase [Streptomyces sp. NPDC050523]|uniref:sulfatase n=1 Tax=Streptomyces sp. NPDC050523 TaxID=3365622 RepID=UPI00379EC01F
MIGIRHRCTTATVVCVAMLVALLASCTGGSNAGQPPGNASASGKPNVVFVLTDDLSWNLVQYMPHVQEMQKHGTTFSNFFVTDSLCCPSRASIFTGQYPHNTGVHTNNAPDGGYNAFQKNHDAGKSFGPALQRAGYRTGFMGKYLNGYQPGAKNGKGAERAGDAEGVTYSVKATHGGKAKNGKKGKHGKNGNAASSVPPGWDEWDVAGNGYREFDYDLSENGKVVHYGNEDKDYLTDVLSSKAQSFVGASAKVKKPFMLEVATFAPHAPATPAPRDADKFSDVKVPRTATYDRASSPKPQWQNNLSPLTPQREQEIDKKFGDRVRSVQAVDAMVGNLEDTLKKQGLADNTYFVFGSDNGFHMGEYQFRPGKQTAYDTDIKVPLVVTGPAVPADSHVTQLAENIDLNPTFQELAGVKPPASVDGRSLAGLLHGKSVDDWRDAVLVEHTRPTSKAGDPDAQPDDSNPPTYEAVRTADDVYVEYADGDREYYDLKTDPDELKNLGASVPEDRRALLHDTLTALKGCKGTESCHAASRIGE